MVRSPTHWPFGKVLDDPFFILRVPILLSSFLGGVKNLKFVQQLVGMMDNSLGLLFSALSCRFFNSPFEADGVHMSSLFVYWGF